MNDEKPPIQDLGGFFSREKSKIQNLYKDVENDKLIISYSMTHQFADFVWSADLIENNRLLHDKISKFENLTIGELADNTKDGEQALANYDLAKSRNRSKCFCNLMQRIDKLYQSSVLHRLVLGKKERLWGVMMGDTFEVILYDEFHLIYPLPNYMQDICKKQICGICPNNLNR